MVRAQQLIIPSQGLLLQGWPLQVHLSICSEVVAPSGYTEAAQSDLQAMGMDVSV